MKFIKENWGFMLVALVCILLGTIAVLSAIKLQQQKAISPTAPKQQRAQEALISCSRSLTFDTTGKEPITASDSAALLEQSNEATKTGTLKFDLKDATKSATPAASSKPTTSPIKR